MKNSYAQTVLPLSNYQANHRLLWYKKYIFSLRPGFLAQSLQNPCNFPSDWVRGASLVIHKSLPTLPEFMIMKDTEDEGWLPEQPTTWSEDWKLPALLLDVCDGDISWRLLTINMPMWWRFHKNFQQWGSESSQVGDHMKVLGGWCALKESWKLCTPSQTPCLRISSFWLLLSWVLYNKLVRVSN